jgi:hypothetical protein
MEATEFASGWFANALELQEMAADAGYIISAELARNVHDTLYHLEQRHHPRG